MRHGNNNITICKQIAVTLRSVGIYGTYAISIRSCVLIIYMILQYFWPRFWPFWVGKVTAVIIILILQPSAIKYALLTDVHHGHSTCIPL